MVDSLIIDSREFAFPWKDAVPPIGKEDLERLDESIGIHGIREPIILDELDNVIDGFNRLQIAAKKGIELAHIPIETLYGLSEEEKEKLAIDLNEARRHMDRDYLQKQAKERRERVKKARAKGESIRTIAEKEGVSHTQVKRDLDSGVTGVTPEVKQSNTDSGAPGGAPEVSNKSENQVSPPVTPENDMEVDTTPPTEEEAELAEKMAASVKGRDGKKYPAKKKAPKPEVNGHPVAADAWGIPITPQAAAAFADSGKFDELIGVLRKAKSLFKELADCPGGKYLTFPGISMNARDGFKHAGIETAILNIQDCKPKYTVCPYEYHSQKHDSECTLCHGLGWIGSVSKDRIPPKLIEAAQKAHGVANV